MKNKESSREHQRILAQFRKIFLVYVYGFKMLELIQFKNTPRIICNFKYEYNICC